MGAGTPNMGVTTNQKPYLTVAQQETKKVVVNENSQKETKTNLFDTNAFADSFGFSNSKDYNHKNENPDPDTSTQPQETTSSFPSLMDALPGKISSGIEDSNQVTHGHFGIPITKKVPTEEVRGKLTANGTTAATTTTTTTKTTKNDAKGIPVTRQKPFADQINKTTDDNIVSVTGTEQGHVAYLADKTEARGLFNRASAATRTGAPLDLATNASVREALELSQKNRLDQTDFNRVLRVPEADAQMNDYLKTLPKERKETMQGVITNGRMADMKNLEEQMRLQARYGASKEEIDATWQQHQALNRGEVGGLDISRYFMESDKTNNTEKLLALDFVNAQKAEHQQKYGNTTNPDIQQAGYYNQSAGPAGVMNNFAQAQRQQQQQNMMMMFMIMMMSGGGF